MRLRHGKGEAMPEDLTVRTPEVLSEEPEQPLIHLVARNPQEMAAAQVNLALWFQNKIALVNVEVTELAGAIDEATAHGWKTSILNNQHKRALVRKQFYEKCLLATTHGYTIIPDIPVDVFAIRTAREKPRRKEAHAESENYEPRAQVRDETPQILAPGEGDYQNPDTFVRNVRGTFKNEKGAEVNFHTQFATDFDEIEFPIIAAVPYVMNATQEAMALKLFDQVGVSPQGAGRHPDPLIIGHILGPHSGYQGRKRCSFLIAWHLDLRTL
jgi:hypothetical protein